LYPFHEQRFLAESITGAAFEGLTSLFGHDGFLVELDQFKKIVKQFLKSKVTNQMSLANAAYDFKSLEDFNQ
ncbi:MAG: hypothetical protein ORN54_11065, partial [Cyclobacteriaceae bacterium]|nr:hypothetical protein [Cyclobacteriaceae bacterium]